MKKIIEKARVAVKTAGAKLWAVAEGLVMAGLALALIAPAPALADELGSGNGTGKSISFLADGILAITVSNAVPFTNLNSVGAYPTNIAGLQFSNNLGAVAFSTNSVITNIVADNSGTNSNGQVIGALTPLTRDVSMWSEQNGNSPTNLSISCTYNGGTGNNMTNALIFVPLWNGEDESTVPGDQFVWWLYNNGTTNTTIATNLFPRWAGALKIRLKAIISFTNSASSQWTIQKLRLNGWPR